MILLLPLKIIEFWYRDAFFFFLRVTNNVLSYLEESLAVGLMTRLLFVPLYHDFSIGGRFLSFFFRLFRIIFGLIVFLLCIILLFILAVTWFALPVLLFLPFIPKYLEYGLYFYFLFGLALLVHQFLNHPLKKVWQVKNLSKIWIATKLKKNEVSWNELVQTYEVKSLLKNLEISPDHFHQVNVPITDTLLQKALLLAQTNQARFLTPAYFWVAMLEQVPNVQVQLLKINLTIEDFEKALGYLEMTRIHWRRVFIWEDDFAVHHLKGTNRGWLGAPTPNLDAVSVDITKKAMYENLPDFAGRKAQLNEVITILSQEKDRNVLIVGLPGSGKTTLVNYLAKMIIAGDAPPSLATKRLVVLDITRILAGINSEGDLAERVKTIFEEVKSIEDIIIFIDEIHDLGTGEASSQFNLYSLMMPYLESDNFQFLASTEPRNYSATIEKNGTFARIFHKVEIPPTNFDETIEVIEKKSIELLRYKKIYLSYLAIKELVQLSEKLIHDRVLPDSALSVLEEAEVAAKNGEIIVEVIKSVMQKNVEVPILEIDNSQKDKLLNMEEIIHKKMIDQVEAVKVVSDTLRRAATALREKNRPIGSFLFVGPTGVGKTELAKTLAEVYFSNSKAFVRFDMSEYQTEEAVNRLLGTTENPGELTEAIKMKPYCLILLDEFEKANTKILTLFLQVLDDGRLTDAMGTTVDFTNTIIIATSNAASVTIAEGIGKNVPMDQLNKIVKDDLLKQFKPELVNRFDEVVIFKPLSEKDLEEVVKIKLKALGEILKGEGYLVEFAPGLVSVLGKKGYDPVLGARPLRRLIQDTLEARLSRLILENRLAKGQVFTADESLVSTL